MNYERKFIIFAKKNIMARTHLCRKISMPPKMIGFKPYGLQERKDESVTLNYDEFESIKYINYHNLQQEEVAEKMNVSRPTVTRIHNNALKKIAVAFIEGQSIEIVGGNVQFDKEWFRCKKCYKLIEGEKNHKRCINCKLFGKDELMNLNEPIVKGKKQLKKIR